MESFICGTGKQQNCIISSKLMMQCVRPACGTLTKHPKWWLRDGMDSSNTGTNSGWKQCNVTPEWKTAVYERVDGMWIVLFWPVYIVYWWIFWPLSQVSLCVTSSWHYSITIGLKCAYSAIVVLLFNRLREPSCQRRRRACGYKCLKVRCILSADLSERHLQQICEHWPQARTSYNL